MFIERISNYYMKLLNSNFIFVFDSQVLLHHEPECNCGLSGNILYPILRGLGPVPFMSTLMALITLYMMHYNLIYQPEKCK